MTSRRAILGIALSTVFLLAVVLAVGLMGTGDFASAQNGPTWIPFIESFDPGAEPGAAALFSNDEQTVVEVTVPGMYVVDVQREGEVFQEIRIPGTGFITDVGKPMVPTFRKLVAIPPASGYELEVTGIQTQRLTGYRLIPVQTPETDQAGNATFAYDDLAYGSDAWYPTEAVKVSRPMIWKDLRVVALTVHPVRTNPVTSELEAISRVELTLKYAGNNPVNPKSDAPARISPFLEKAYRASVVNFDLLGLEPAETDAGVDYLIICKPGFEEEIQPLADWYTTAGMSVSVVNTTTTGTTDTQIKDYILTVYADGDSDLDYVLFAGDVEDIPFHTTSGDSGDFWYTQLEGDDFFSEIGIGRMPAKEEADLTHVVGKTLVWLDDGAAGAWQGNSVLIAHKQDYPGKYTQCKEEIRTFAYSYDPPIFDTVYGGAGGTNADVIAAIEEGRVIVNYRGHGGVGNWSSWDAASADFTNQMAKDLVNGDMTPVVFSIACHNAEIQSASETLSEAFFFADDGAVAFLGATDPSYTIPNHDFDKFLYRSIYDEAITALGDVLTNSNTQLWLLYEGESEQSWAETNIRIYIWLGDPALQVAVSGLLSPNEVNAVATGTDSIAVTWNDRTEDETGFILERKVGAEGAFEVLETLDPDTESYDDTGLDEGTVYTYRLKTIKDSEESRYSGEATTSTLSLAPTNLEAVSDDPERIVLSWEDNSAGEQEYVIERKAAGEAEFTELARTEADVTGYEDEGLTEGTQYSYRVIAANMGGDSDPSNVATTYTIPLAPTDLEWSPESESAVRLDWTDNSAGETGFVIERRDPDKGAWENVGGTGEDETTYTDEGLTEATEYEYQVRAQNSGGTSEPTDIVLGETLPAGPTGLAAVPASQRQVNLTWIDNSGGETGYVVQRSVGGNEFADLATVHEGGTIFSDVGLDESTFYTYRVRAYSLVGDSEYSAEVETATFPNPPATVNAEADGTDAADVAWTDSSEGEEGYRVYRRESGTSEFVSIAELDADLVEYQDTGLDPDTGYTYRIAAYNQYAESVSSNEDRITTEAEEDEDDGGSGGIDVACWLTGPSGASAGTVLVNLLLLAAPALMPLIRRRGRK